MMNNKVNESTEIKEPQNEILLQSTEEIVCSPEFPDGCMDVEQ